MPSIVEELFSLNQENLSSCSTDDKILTMAYIKNLFTRFNSTDMKCTWIDLQPSLP